MRLRADLSGGDEREEEQDETKAGHDTGSLAEAALATVRPGGSAPLADLGVVPETRTSASVLHARWLPNRRARFARLIRKLITVDGEGPLPA